MRPSKNIAAIRSSRPAGFATRTPHAFHIYGPGTLSLAAEILIPTGLRKMVIVNSHGGNLDVMNIVARIARSLFDGGRRHTVVTLRQPQGLIGEHEQNFGIHGGMEASMMLHFRLDLVRMDKAENFPFRAEWMKDNTRYLQPLPPHYLA
ncbi:creatininase family protein [Neorhizobium alkalisoli]|uniref:creatininase family protein n=1 Tax=Neorhizobium alkalisoli TaxID=528178 RepID=UPI000CF94E66|nr:creatininase family protein [Neorhizobium alkalisoli]